MLHGPAVALTARGASAIVALLLAAAFVSLMRPSRAEAQASGPRYGRAAPFLPVRLEGHGANTWDGVIALGGRLEIPIATAAALRYNTRDEVAITLGGDVTLFTFAGETKPRGYPVLAFQWSLGVNDRFYFFPELGIAARIDKSGWRPTANLGFGARYYLRRSFGIFARLGYPIALAAGTMF